MDFSGIRDKCAADMTERGKYNIQSRCQERLQHVRSEAEIGIDHQDPNIRHARLTVYNGRDPAEAVG
jgi:hypothetical protein